MKTQKRFLFVTLLFLVVLCVGCGKETPKPTPPGPGPTPIDEPTYDFMGTNFTIMVDSPSTTDPRESGYAKLFKEEKIARINAIESKYNLKIVFAAYPSDASWGGARERYIIQNSIAGTPKAHIYEIPSYSIGSLAVANAISPLDEYVSKYVTGYWSEAINYGTAMNKLYSFQDYYPVADEGIFYNIDLLKEYLGEENGDLPSRLWLSGEWTWQKYLEICNSLNSTLPNGYFVMGGTAYNWMYQFLGSNGIHVVDNNLVCQLDTQEAIDTFTFVNNLQKNIRWDIDSCDLANATSTEMVKGKVAFHNGQSYWIYQANKWLDKDFDIGFVPYPKGPNVSSDLSNYYINDIYGVPQYVISSSYSKDKIKPGYENSTLHDEIIFQIWQELQVFPAIDPTTGSYSIDDYVEEYITERIAKYYGNEASVMAKMTVINKGYCDYFYSLDEAKAQSEGSYMLMIQSTVKGEVDDIRASVQNIKALVHAAFIQKYNLGEDYYD